MTDLVTRLRAEVDEDVKEPLHRLLDEARRSHRVGRDGAGRNAGQVLVGQGAAASIVTAR